MLFTQPRDDQDCFFQDDRLRDDATLKPASRLILRILEHFHTREWLSCKHRERSPTAGRDMGHLVGKPKPGHRISGRTPADNRGAREGSKGRGDPTGPFCKLRDLKDPIRPFQTTVRRPASS